MKNRVQLLRQQKGITQAELAKLLGVSPSTIGMYEQGRRSPDADTLIALAKHFNVTTDYLLGLDEEKQKAVDEATALYDNLSPEDKGKVESYIKFLASQK